YDDMGARESRNMMRSEGAGGSGRAALLKQYFGGKGYQASLDVGDEERRWLTGLEADNVGRQLSAIGALMGGESDLARNRLGASLARRPFLREERASDSYFRALDEQEDLDAARRKYLENMYYAFEPTPNEKARGAFSGWDVAGDSERFRGGMMADAFQQAY